MISSSIKLIGFDLDDTLWPCMPTIIKAEEMLYQWLSENYPLITHRYSMTSMMGLRNDFAIKHPELMVDLTQMRVEFLKLLATTCHYAPTEVSQQGVKVFLHWRNVVNYYPDAIPALKKLSDQYIIATISNGNADVMVTEAAPFISYAINAADVKAAKPDIKMFQSIAQQAGLKASECLYIGDDIENDVIGAKNANWDAIWINRENTNQPRTLDTPLKTICSLAEL